MIHLTQYNEYILKNDFPHIISNVKYAFSIGAKYLYKTALIHPKSFWYSGFIFHLNNLMIKYHKGQDVHNFISLLSSKDETWFFAYWPLPQFQVWHSLNLHLNFKIFVGIYSGKVVLKCIYSKFLSLNFIFLIQPVFEKYA